MASANTITNPFSNAIQLEEITHFQRPTKSILNTFRNFGPKKVSYAEDTVIVTAESSDEENTHGPIPGSSNSVKQSKKLADVNSLQLEGQAYFKKENENGLSHASSSSSLGSESDTEFHRDYLNNKSSASNNTNNSNYNRFDKGFMNDSISDENLFPIPNIEVTKLDLIFAFISLLTNLGELVTDFTLAVWHFQTGQKWACGFTAIFISLGGIGMLHQFSLLQPDHLNRLFRKGKRVRILVNCFPPAASLIVSFEGTLTAWRAFKQPMVSQQYFKIYELLRSLSRVQSFFQAAPQATLQLLVLLENYHETSSEKAFFTAINIFVSVVIMTNANLPSKIDTPDDGNPNRAAYLPLSRVFVGMRMFSSLGSRIMALTYLLVGCRCLLNEDGSSSFTSTLIGIALLMFPRLVFTLTDYFTVKIVSRRNLEHYREQPEIGISSSHPIAKMPFVDAFVGYLATIFFPVGDPLWLFWYLWSESGIFVIFGNVSGITHDCIDNEVNGIYTGVFFVVFIIVPIVIPYVKAAVNRQKVRKFTRVLEIVDDDTNHSNIINNGNSNNTGRQQDGNLSNIISTNDANTIA